jgi:hypothetical protein
MGCQWLVEVVQWMKMMELSGQNRELDQGAKTFL